MANLLKDETMIEGQAEIFRYMYNFVESMALKSVVELGVADIINSHGRPITQSQIASHIVQDPSYTVFPDRLYRIMRLLVRKKIFSATTDAETGETLYGLTSSSKWLLSDAELNLTPLILLSNHPIHQASWHSLSKCVMEGGRGGYEKAHGLDLYDYQSKNPEFKKVFMEGMACTSRIVMKAMVGNYGDGFEGVGSVVDVGGGDGTALAEIVKAYPHIKAINFDLPHVIDSSIKCPGVSHVGGDMFQAIPLADAVLMKWILHNWSDEDCTKILVNCRKAIPNKTGKIIIIDAVLEPNGEGLFDDAAMRYDLVMMAQTSNGKERTEAEWKQIFSDGGFRRYKIIKIPAFLSIIEAYPE